MRRSSPARKKPQTEIRQAVSRLVQLQIDPQAVLSAPTHLILPRPPAPLLSSRLGQRRDQLRIPLSPLIVVRAIIETFDRGDVFHQLGREPVLVDYPWSDRLLDHLATGELDIGKLTPCESGRISANVA